HLDPTVCDLEFARALAAAAESCGRPLRFHVEVDTGMGRIGVREEEAEGFLALAAALPGLRLASVYTHFPDADADDLSFARVQVRDLPAGATVSYGRTYAAPRAIRMGVVAVGYGHGYSWLLSNRGHMLVGGRRVPILGRVTMDLTMVDLAEAPSAAVGDEVVIFGDQHDDALSIEEVARGS